MREHQADHILAAEKHSPARAELVKAAIGDLGAPKYVLPVFSVTNSFSEKFRAGYDRVDWRRECDDCGEHTFTTWDIKLGKNLCKDCHGRRYRTANDQDRTGDGD